MYIVCNQSLSYITNKNFIFQDDFLYQNIPTKEREKFLNSPPNVAWFLGAVFNGAVEGRILKSHNHMGTKWTFTHTNSKY